MAQKNRRSLLLTLVAFGLALTGWSLVTSSREGWQSGEGRLLLPELAAAPDAVSEIRIEQRGEGVTLKRREGADWVIPEMSDYPVDVGRLRGLIVELSKSRLIEEKTAKEENHHRLGLGETQAVTVILKGKETKLGEVLLGNLADRRRATYARYPENPQTWATSGQLQPKTDARQWVRQQVLDVKENRVRRVTIQHTGKEALVIARASAEGEFTVTPKPKEVNPSVEYQLSTTPRLFTRLTLIDVITAAKLTSSSADVTEMETFDGLTIRLRFNGEGEASERWVTLEADASEAATEVVRKEAAEITARSSGWAYRFPPYLMTQLRLTPESLAEYKGPLPVK